MAVLKRGTVQLLRMSKAMKKVSPSSRKAMADALRDSRAKIGRKATAAGEKWGGMLIRKSEAQMKQKRRPKKMPRWA